jgi:hypothetical protein
MGQSSESSTEIDSAASAAHTVEVERATTRDHESDMQDLMTSLEPREVVGV